MAILAVAVLVATTAAVQDRSVSGDGARLRADYDRELALLRQEQQKTLLQIRAEAVTLEERVDVIRRLTPDQFYADALESRIRALAKSGEMNPVAIRRIAAGEKVFLPNGRPTPYERFFMELSGEDSFIRLGYFLDRLGRLPQLVELQTLSLEPGSQGSVRFAARLAFPCMTGTRDSSMPAPPTVPPPIERQSPSSERAVYEGALEAQRRHFARVADQAREAIRRLQDEVIAVAEMKTAGAPARFFAALSRFDDGTKDGRVALTRARFGPQTVIEGAVAGARSRAVLRPALEGAGFVVEKLDVAAGGCSTFSLAARLAPREPPVAGADVEVGDDRFRAATCTAPPAASLGQITARGASGPITASLRDIDVSGLFRFLYTLGQGNYVVDVDVKGRVNVDFQRATLDEALAAIVSAGIKVGPGPLRRVSRAGTTQAASRRTESREHAINLDFSDGALVDVVRLFEEISERKAWTAPVIEGRVTIFATEIEWDTALEGIAASNGLATVFEDERIFVGPSAMAKAPWKSGAVDVRKARATDIEPRWDRVADVRKLNPEDLTPVGIAWAADGMKALAYGPGRLLWILSAGDALSDATVERVEANSVTFVGKDGRKTAVRFVP